MTTNDTLFFQRVGSICTHTEETIGTDLFLKITVDKVSVNPTLTFQSTIMYINQNGKLKMCKDYTFPLSTLRKDEWCDIFINQFGVAHPECKTLLGVLTNDKNLVWYIQFATAQFGANAIDRDGQRMLL